MEWTQVLTNPSSGSSGPPVSPAQLLAYSIFLTPLGCVEVLINGALCFGLHSVDYNPPRLMFSLIMEGQTGLSHEEAPQLKSLGLATHGLAFEKPVRAEPRSGIILECIMDGTTENPDEQLTDDGDSMTGCTDHILALTDGSEVELNKGSAISTVDTSATKKSTRLSSRVNPVSFQRAISRNALLREGEVSIYASHSRKSQKGSMKKITAAGLGTTKLNKVKSKSALCGISLTDAEAGSFIMF